MAGMAGRFAPIAFAVALAALPAVARAPVAPAIERGLWRLEFEDGRAPREVCAGAMSGLAQIEHRGGGCSGFLLRADASEGTWHYTCAGEGFGRTTVRRVTPRSVLIDTQGLSNALPFAYKLSARLVGACSR